MSKLDPTGQNTEFYKKKFAKMNDKQFYDFFNQDFPLKFQTKVFEVDPITEEIVSTSGEAFISFESIKNSTV